MTTVGFLDVAATARWIAQRGPEAVIGRLIDALADDLARWEELDKRPRIATHSRDGVIELMPTADDATYGFKFVNGHPSNPARGFQTVTAFGVLADVHNGYPTFLAEMTLLTALRTAATSALAARHLARQDSRTLALIGCGSQSEFQALGMRAALGVTHLRAWDTDPAARAKLARNARALGFEVHEATSGDDAVTGADIITTCTADKANATVLTLEMVTELAHPGVHVNAIGGDCPGKTELDPRILHAADVVVEYEPQTRIEGEIQQTPDLAVTELWEIVTGRRPGRRETVRAPQGAGESFERGVGERSPLDATTGRTQVTVFDSVGFAVEDWTVLRLVRDDVPAELLAHLDLIAEPADPKDLFSLVRDAGGADADAVRHSLDRLMGLEGRTRPHARESAIA
ncbi:ornithine cyclodeaminase [Isoptericola sp. NEAU-Y5]|uniref:Ornithine cyclodeaminase n=1 Tax=Isoptericola luteus TaxID=2879484 RepID=A0ABS7ZKY6_9MICO|nr:ornithine cyclodeaminase [Isoptericola sp. NEAU-Y5]MCA5894440.1 ornithine cyclodeaminase [Isoptericola sp. NEAU-Y5]